MKVKIFTTNTTAGKRYGLKFASSGDVLTYAWSKWKTEQGAKRYAAKMGYTVVE